MEIRERTKVGLMAVGAGLWLLAAATPGRAGNISGQVIDQATGAGMANITVNLYDPAGDAKGTTTTNASGNYSFTNVASGNYLIQEDTPGGMYQSNSTFPNYTPVPQSSPGAYGNTPGTWDYSGTGGATPPGWLTSGTAAPFESALSLSGPTVNLGQFVQENFSNTSNYSLKLQSTVPGDPGYQIQATSFGVPEAVNLNGTTFNLSNIHYHDPEENQINGTSPGVMEEHFVLQSPVVNGAGGGEVVLAVFMQLGTAANPTFDKLFGALTGLGTTGGSTLAGSTVGGINFADLLPANMQGWFYPGSLTTPPLSTPVSWFVFSTPIELDQAELNEYEAYASSVGFLPNARPVQDLEGRTFNDLTSVTLGATDLTGVNIINAAVPEPSSLILLGTAGASCSSSAAEGRGRPPDRNPRPTRFHRTARLPSEGVEPFGVRGPWARAVGVVAWSRSKPGALPGPGRHGGTRMNVLDRFRLDGKVALVTGGARGLGRVIAEALHSAGAAVALSARHLDHAARAAAELVDASGGRALGVAADVSRDVDVRGMVAQVLDAYGRLDILVNNAGINIRGPIEQLGESDWDQVVDTNLKGPWLCCRAASEPMRRQKWGRVINVSSMLGEVALAGTSLLLRQQGGPDDDDQGPWRWSGRPTGSTSTRSARARSPPRSTRRS